MARQLTDLDELFSNEVSDTDYLLIRDVSSRTDKKITAEALKTAFLSALGDLAHQDTVSSSQMRWADLPVFTDTYSNSADFSVSFLRAIRIGKLLVVNVNGVVQSAWGDSDLRLFSLDYAAMGCVHVQDGAFLGSTDGGNNVVMCKYRSGGVYTVDSTLGRGGGVASGNVFEATFSMIVEPIEETA